MRDGGNRSSLENKNCQMSSASVSQSQNIASYSPANVHGQRSYAPNVVPATNHSQQNVPLQQSKSQRTSPISVNTLPNGNSDYQPKSLPPVSHSPTHQYHNQNQQSQNQSGNSVLNAQHQRKHPPHHHQSNSRGANLLLLNLFFLFLSLFLSRSLMVFLNLPKASHETRFVKYIAYCKT
jgi:hypothetical protein